MKSKFYSNVYNPDVLSCIANLSSDEVFTSPNVVNDMLDLLPQELFTNPKTTFLDPACKSGVFLREIAKRLLKGLEKEIPDLQKRTDHIFHKQLFAISITELTSLLSRRSVYCSKFPNGKYSVSKFDDDMGNIIFNRIEHTWENGRCIFCGADKNIWDRGSDFETHAYQFIHTKNPEEIFNMNFDVIIGNPPYQLNTGGFSAQATPLYDKFIIQAKKLNPRFLVMIVPARWFSGGMGLDNFRNEMLNDKQLRIIHDFIDASECFPGVEIKGGVCYFLWSKGNKGACEIFTHMNSKITNSTRYLLEEGSDIFIRYNEAIPILKKIRTYSNKYLVDIIQSLGIFGLPTNFKDYKENNFKDAVTVYGNKFVGFMNKNLIKSGNNLIDKYKVLLPKAIGIGGFDLNLNPIVTNRNSCCTFTYVVIGAFNNKQQAENLSEYLKLNLVKFLIGLRKITQDATKKVYQFVPMQNFNEPWTDEKLYKKYKLTKEEISFIESMIKPMDDNAENGGKDE